MQKFGLETLANYTEDDQIYQGYDGRIFGCSMNQAHNVGLRLISLLCCLLSFAIYQAKNIHSLVKSSADVKMYHSCS